MLSTVTRLKPRVADFEVAMRAFLQGDFSHCLEALSQDSSMSACFLRSRALMRIGDFSNALASLADFSALGLSHEYAAELLVLRTYNLLLLRDPEMEATLTEARARAFSSGFAPVECEVEYVAAYAAWLDGRVDEVLSVTSRLLSLCEAGPLFLGPHRSDYMYTAGYWRSRAYDLRGMVDATREDYEAQAASLANAFVEFDRGEVQDIFFESRMLSNFAVLVRDVESDFLASYLESRADRLAWHPATALEEFQVYQAIGWNRAKRGDHLGAFRNLRRSASAAPTIPGRIRAILDRSFLARELGEILTAQDELDHAVKLAKKVDWENSSASERSTLFELARLVAPLDTKSGRALWDRYNALKSSASKAQLANRGDRRQRADECSALATVLIAEGQRSRAITLLLESFDIWNEVGYVWRAAAVAAELADLTGEPRYSEFATREAAKQPNSWLARRAASLRV